MSLQQTLQVFELLDSAYVKGEDIVELFAKYPEVSATTHRVNGSEGSTDFVRIVIPGTNGKLNHGNARTLGIVGLLGGIGARPSRIGMVSDADGAIAAIASALKLAQMKFKGDSLAGDIVVITHICTDAPTKPHHPVDFMDSPIDMNTMNENEFDSSMEAVLSFDTTKGNRIINHKGYALSPTVKQGYILRVSEDLLRIMEIASGHCPETFPITMQDITPYSNGIHHLNGILQPSTVTDAPVVGVAICTQSVVPGSGTGASHEIDIAGAVKFAVEVAKEYGNGTCNFYDHDEFMLLNSLYGSMAHLQGKK